MSTHAEHFDRDRFREDGCPECAELTGLLRLTPTREDHQDYWASERGMYIKSLVEASRPAMEKLTMSFERSPEDQAKVEELMKQLDVAMHGPKPHE